MSESKANTPKLRFPGFTGPWEQRKLGDCGTTYSGLSGKTKDDFGHGEAHFVPYTNVFDNPITDVSRLESVSMDAKQHEVKRGDVFFTVSSETPREVGMSSVWLSDQPNVYLNSFCFGYRQGGSFDDMYLAYMLRSNVFRSQVELLAQGISRFNISKNKVMDIVVPVPTMYEQRQLGAFFRDLDDLITLHQRKLEHLRLQKRGLLQKMFPRNGADVPEVRFPGFTGPWEQRKLGELTSILSAARVHRSEWCSEGVPFYRSSDVVSKFNGAETEKVYISLELFEKLRVRSGAPERGDVMITGGGSVGIPYIVPDDKPLYTKDADLIWIKHCDGIDPGYLYAYFTSPVFRTYIASISHVGTIAHYTIEQVQQTPIPIAPFIEEQRLVGAFFRELDDLIALHQRKLEHLKAQKRALLQQMFI